MAKPSTGGKGRPNGESVGGDAVDSTGNRAKDPSYNVQAWTEAANQRQDDLRVANKELFQAQFKCLEETLCLHVKHIKEMGAAESRRVDEQAQLRADFADKLSNAEAKRIDAIRSVDVNAVGVASQRADDKATALANQVIQSAEALRVVVATTASTAAQTQQQQSTALSARITTLEQAQYKGEGKQSFVDPQMAELMADLKSMRGTKSEGIDKTWGVIAVVLTLIISASVAFVVTTRSPTAAAPPQIIYVPATAPSPTIPAPNAVR